MDQVYKAISHPVRRRILHLIKEHGVVSFSQLIGQMELEVGTFYYHLDALKPLLTQTPDKQYKLSPLGDRVLEVMRQLEQLSTETSPPTPSPTTKLSYWLGQAITPSRLFSAIARRPRRFLFEALIIALMNGWVVAIAGLQPFIFYVTSSPSPNLIYTIATFVGGWLIFFILVEGLMRLLFHNKYGTEALLVLLAFIRLPVAIYALLWLFHDMMPWISPLGWLALQLTTELWSTWLAVIATSNAKLARRECAAVCVLLIRLAIIVAYSLLNVFFP